LLFDGYLSNEIRLSIQKRIAVVGSEFDITKPLTT